MGARQFHRQIKVTLGSGAVQTVLVDFDTSRPTAEQEKALDCRFTIERFSKPEPQPSRVSVWGLSETTRETLSRKIFEAREQSWRTQQALRVARIRVEAGRPQSTGILSDDYVIDVTHGRDGADWRTDFVCQDGRLAWASAFVSESRSDTIDPIAFAAKQQEALGLFGGSPVTPSSANMIPEVAAGGFKGFQGGLSLFGAYQDQNRQLLSAIGYRPIWRRGTLQWTRPDLADLTPAVVLREANASRTSPLLYLSEAGAFGVRKAKVLLDPLLEISRQVILFDGRDRRISQWPYRVDSATYTGATREVAFYADLILRPSPPDGLLS